jgi:hypothetical protein
LIGRAGRHDQPRESGLERRGVPGAMPKLCAVCSISCGGEIATEKTQCENSRAALRA